MTERAPGRPARPARFGALLLGLALAVAACSSSTKHSSTNGSTTSSNSSAAGAIDPAAKAAITKAYLTFFNPKSPEGESLADLQHGNLFKAAVESQASTSQAQGASVKVAAVRLLSEKVAEVTFTIYIGSQAVLPNTKGKAVLEGGKWKLAAETFCALLKLEGAAPAACNDPKVTALP